MIWVLFSPLFLDSLLVTVSGFVGLMWSTFYFNLSSLQMSASTLLVFPLGDIERVLEWRDRLSQIAQLLENGLRKHTCRSGIRREASKSKSRKSLFHFKPEKVNKTFRNKTFSKASAETEKACLYKIICMQSVICVCKSVHLNLHSILYFLCKTSKRHLDSCLLGDTWYDVILWVLEFNVRAYKQARVFFRSELLCLLRRTDEPQQWRNSCLLLQPRSVLVLSVSCWCLAKLIFT